MKRLGRRWALGALTVAFASGCFTYIPTEIDSVPLGSDVRVFLTRDGMERLQELEEAGLRIGERPTVSGALVSRQADRFAVRIPVASRQVGFLQDQIGQQVTLSMSEMVQAELKMLSRVRTGLALVGTSAAVGAVIVAIVKGARDEAPRPTPEPGDAWIPVFSFPLP